MVEHRLPKPDARVRFPSAAFFVPETGQAVPYPSIMSVWHSGLYKIRGSRPYRNHHTVKRKGDVNRLPSALRIHTLFFGLLCIRLLLLATQIFSDIGFFLAFFQVVVLLKRLIVIDGVIRVEIRIARITVQFRVIGLHGLLILLVNVFVIQNALLSNSILVRRLF